MASTVSADTDPSVPGRTWHRLVVRVPASVPASVTDEFGARCHELGSCGVLAEEVGDQARLSAYFSATEDVERLRSVLAAALCELGLQASAIDVDAQVEPERDWNAAWKQFYAPVWATERIVVHPPWIPVHTDAGQFAIAIDPAMAFGTGGHESTQLALRALEASDLRGSACLDVGTGSGVLSIAAMRLHAASVTAVDVDPVAIDNARLNTQANLGDGADAVRFVLGSVEDVGESSFVTIVANLESHLVRPLLPAIIDRLAPAGEALFSGLVRGEQERFVGWLAEHGLHAEQTWTQGDWFSVRARAGGA